jgi:hypothetical protein
MRYLAIVGVVGMGFATANANAVVIKPTGAVASSQFSSAYDPGNTIDGSGLTGLGTDIAEAHATYTTNNHWTTANGTDPLTQWIDWTFSTPVTLGAAYIWNHRSNNIASNSGYEPTLFDLTLFNANGDVLLSLDNKALAPDTAFAQKIDFVLTANVARVRFDVEAVQSSPNYTGLAEVAFDTESAISAVPEPASWAMLIAGFGLVGATLRRQRAGAAAFR